MRWGPPPPPSRCSRCRTAVLRWLPRHGCTRSRLLHQSPWLVATPTSTNPRLRAPRNRRWLVVQIVIAVVVIVSIGWALIKQWRDFRDTPLTADPQWGYIVLSAAV